MVRKHRVRYAYNLDNKKSGVLIPWSDFQKIEEDLEEYYFHRILKDRDFENEPTYTLEEVRRETAKRRK